MNKFLGLLLIILGGFYLKTVLDYEYIGIRKIDKLKGLIGGIGLIVLGIALIFDDLGIY